MKNLYLKNFKKVLVAIFLSLLIGYSARATETTLVTLDSISLATAITGASTGDVIVLPTGTLKLIIAGNSFSVTNKILTFQAATGAKPVIGAIIKVGGTAVLPAGVIFNGIEFDQSLTPANRNYVVQLSGTIVSRVQFINCNIHHVARSVVTGTTSGTQPLDSLIIDNSMFYSLGPSTGYYGVFTGGGTTSYLKGFKASNSTFIKLAGGIIKLSQCKNDTAQRITFNQCTIDSVYGMTTALNPVVIKLNSSPTVPYTKVWSFTMTNCIMSNFYDFGTTGTTWGGIVTGANITGSVSNIRYFNISLNTGGTNNTTTALTQTNTSVEDPQYYDPSWLKKDYTLGNTNFLTASTTGGIIGDPRWSPATDAYLAKLVLNGSPVSGFNSTTSVYNINLLYNPSAPVVTYTTQNAEATVIKTPYGTNGLDSTVLVVTSKSGTVHQKYKLVYTILPPSSDATLKSLSFNGTSIFAAGVYKFGVLLPKGTTAVPDNSLFTYLTNNAFATTEITKATSLTDSTVIKVTAQDASFKTYKIGFSVTPWSVTVASNPVAGGTATLAGGKTNYQANEVATLSAVTNTGYDFVAWKNNTSGSIYSYHSDTILTVTHDSSLVAVFALKTYSVAAVAAPLAGGTITGIPSAKVDHGTSVTLTAVPATGYSFVNWTKGTTVLGTNTDFIFTATKDTSVTANFSTIAVTSVTVTAAGNATTITSKGGTLQMTASMAPANAFNQNVTWSVDDNSKATISTTGLLTAKIDGTVTVTATSQDNTAIKGTLAITISGQATALPSISMAAIKVYPNPATDVIKVISEQKSEVTIYNILGSVELSKLVDANGTINIQNLKDGVYIIHVKSGSEVKTVRLLKQ
jgi:hypothetical protein